MSLKLSFKILFLGQIILKQNLVLFFKKKYNSKSYVVGLFKETKSKIPKTNFLYLTQLNCWSLQIRNSNEDYKKYFLIWRILD